MKKIIPYILIFVIILQLFAPFSVGINDGKVGVSKNIASAKLTEGNIHITADAKVPTATVTVEIDFENSGITIGSVSMLYFKLVQIVKKENGKEKEGEEYPITLRDTGNNTLKGTTIIPELTVSSNYTYDFRVVEVTTDAEGYANKEVIVSKKYSFTTSGSPEETVSITNEDIKVENVKASTNNLPICNISHIGGCIAQILYYVLFVPTSALFGLTGKFLDFTVMYSLSDTSYRSDFIVEGWGLVRDFCNMFFIFVLLYIAFGTILNLHDVKTKEMIISVVIIGLLMNFSLFATRVIIDTSNILARVFYNQETIATGSEKDANGNIISELGDNGEIKLSEAIIDKVDPQKLIINAKKVSAIQVKGKANNEEIETTTQEITTSAFILITVLATAVNIFGMMAFLSCGIIFVSRVIGLWLAMILVPLVFFSYTVPALQSMKMVGWKHWWPETLKLAFLAPIFTFFMYIIVGFMGKGLDIINADSKTGLSFVIAIMVPFIFIIVLLNKAKDIAKDMSGEIGQSITKGINAIGGVALGAGLGGAALLGRASLGRVANKLGNSNWLNDSASGKNGKMAQIFGKAGKNLTNFTSKSSFDFRQTKAGNAFSKEMAMNLDTGTNALGLDTKKGLGGYAGVQQRKVEKENKFGETLGYDHHKYEEIGDDIAGKEEYLKKFKADKTKDHNDSNYKAEVAQLENELDAKKKEQERVKTGRAKEHALTMKRKSGKIYDIDMTRSHIKNVLDKYRAETDVGKKEKLREEYEHAKHAYEHKKDYRDDNGNIKRFGHANSDGAQAAKTIMKEFAKGMAQGAATGAIAGSVIPGLGTVVGAGVGGLIGAVRSTLIEYSGTTNRKVGEESHGDKHEVKDNYKAPTISTPAPSSHGAPAHDEGGGHGHH